ncbi:MAG: glycosyltransferase family 87 protein [Isosphaeraceae bacterium]
MLTRWVSRPVGAVRRLPFGFGLTLTITAVALFNLVLIARALPVGYGSSDYKFAAAAARAGFKFGWNRIYDLSLPRWDLTGVSGPVPSFIIFVPNPPPFVWLAAPFSLLPSQVGYVLWALLMLASLVVASQLLAGPGWSSRIRAAAVVLALLPAVATVIFGQVTALLILALALCWALAGRGRETLAGVVLAVAIIKPHLLLLVPFTLLASGRWRVFVGWSGAAMVLALASVASLGLEGSRQYLSFITTFDSGQRDAYSLASVFGNGFIVLGARAAIVGLALAAAYLGRDRGVTPAIAAGVAGSLLVSGYLNAFDLALYAPVILMLARDAAAWRLALVVSGVLWLALTVAISSGWLIILLETAFLLALLQPLLPVPMRSRRNLPSMSEPSALG